MSSPVVRRERPSGGTKLPIALALVCLLGACASQPAPPPRRAAQTPAADPVRLVWLPVESLVAPAIAATANDALARVRPRDATQSARAPVSMEVAQLTIECIQPTPACHAAVGRSLGADRLLWVEVRAPAGAPAVAVALEVFDVGRGASLQHAERTFKDATDAGAGIAAFIENAVAAKRTP